MMMKRKSLNVKAGGEEDLTLDDVFYGSYISPRSQYMCTRELITICLCTDGLKVEDIRG